MRNGRERKERRDGKSEEICKVNRRKEKNMENMRGKEERKNE